MTLKKLLPLAAVTLLLFLFVIPISCRKSETSPEHRQNAQFFPTGKKADQAINRLVSDLKENEAFMSQLPRFMEENGVPNWDIVRHSFQRGRNSNLKATGEAQATVGATTTSDQGIFFIPLLDEGNHVTSYIAVRKMLGDNYHYQLYQKEAINTINPTDATGRKEILNTLAVFAFFEQQINGTNSFKVDNPYLGVEYLNGADIRFELVTRNVVSQSSAIERIATGGVQDCVEIKVIVDYDPNCVSTTVYACPQGGEEFWIAWPCSSGGGTPNVPIYDPFPSYTDPSGSPPPNQDPNYNYPATGAGAGGWWNNNTGSQGGPRTRDEITPWWDDPNGTYLDGYWITPSRYPGMMHGWPYFWWEDDEWIDTYMTAEYGNYGLNDAEKALCKEHPWEAQSLYRNAKAAYQAEVARYGGNFRNVKSDAFRHAFLNAINYRDMGKVTINGIEVSIAKLFSDAHETTTPPAPILEKQMDIFNNAIGHQVGKTLSITTLNSTVSDLIYNKLIAGDLRYLHPLDVTNQIIPNVTTLIPTNQP